MSHLIGCVCVYLCGAKWLKKHINLYSRTWNFDFVTILFKYIIAQHTYRHTQIKLIHKLLITANLFTSYSLRKAKQVCKYYWR